MYYIYLQTFGEKKVTCRNYALTWSDKINWKPVKKGNGQTRKEDEKNVRKEGSIERKRWK